MTNRIITYLSFLLLTTLVGCNNSVKNTATYFGGKIINPKSNKVVLYAMDKVIDTFFVNSENKFFGQLDSIQEGLFYFVHGNENQYIYLEPKDSLMLSLNTWDFDESLVFSGNGAERNNLLIDCFLQYEKDRKLFYSYNSLKAESFKSKVDSLIELKLKTYEDYVINHPTETKAFNNVLKVALTFPIYSRIESYPIVHAKKMGLKEFPKTPSNFYNFRANIDANKDSLMYYYPYADYINNYLYNATYSKGHKPMFNNFSSDFTVDLLKTIDAKIVSETSKNTFLRQTLMNHFYNKSTCDVNNDQFDTFFKLSSNKEDKELIRKLHNDNNLIHKNHKLIDFSVLDFTNANHNISNVIKDKNTFLFFWNSEYVSKAYLKSRISYLESKYPDVQFLTIKIDGNINDRVEKLDIKNQFFLAKNSKANSFLTSKLTRSILINKKGIVTNGYASISSRNVYKQLEELSKN